MIDGGLSSNVQKFSEPQSIMIFATEPGVRPEHHLLWCVLKHTHTHEKSEEKTFKLVFEVYIYITDRKRAEKFDTNK